MRERSGGKQRTSLGRKLAERVVWIRGEGSGNGEKWVDGKSILDLGELDNGLGVESIPRILACTRLSIAFTTNYLSLSSSILKLIKFGDVVFGLPHLGAQ